MIIALSDLHLGHDKSDHKTFQSFIDSELNNLDKKDHLVLLGDIIEFWREQNLESITENNKILQDLYELTNKTNVHYIYGNHDYTISKLSKRFKKFPFQVTHDLRLNENDNKFYFLHGYELEVYASLEPLTVEDYEKLCEGLCDRTEKYFGNFLSLLWDMTQIGTTTKDFIHSITKSPHKRNLENKIDKMVNSFIAKSIFLGISKDEFLVFGHTHIPTLHKDNKWANSGSWLRNEKTYNTYIKIEGNEIDLIHYPDNKIMQQILL